MATFKIEKVVSSLPSTLVADTVYAVRTGNGFDLYITDNTGNIAHRVNSTSTIETNPILTYTSTMLTRIDYDSGNYKTFAYTLGVLTQFDYVQGAVTTRKTFAYNPDGTLASIEQMEI